jgi:hypothetical protein
MSAITPTTASTITTSRAIPQPISLPAQGDLPCGAGGVYPPAGDGWGYEAAGGGEYAVGGGG